jgi:hypothetical protein
VLFRSPELWIAPYSGWGILLGQVLDIHGRPLYGTPITVYNSHGKYVDALSTYGNRVANPDDQWHEQFVDSDLPAGTYHIQAAITSTISGTAEIMAGDVTLIAGQPHFVVFQEGVGFIDNAAPAQTATPPYPSDTPTYTPTPTTTDTPTFTRTPRPTYTPSATRTPWLSPTPLPTRTPWPTFTLTPSLTRWPTWTPTPSRTPRYSPTPLLLDSETPTPNP